MDDDAFTPSSRRAIETVTEVLALYHRKRQTAAGWAPSNMRVSQCVKRDLDGCKKAFGVIAEKSFEPPKVYVMEFPSGEVHLYDLNSEEGASEFRERAKYDPDNTGVNEQDNVGWQFIDSCLLPIDILNLYARRKFGLGRGIKEEKVKICARAALKAAITEKMASKRMPIPEKPLDEVIEDEIRGAYVSFRSTPFEELLFSDNSTMRVYDLRINECAKAFEEMQRGMEECDMDSRLNMGWVYFQSRT